MKKWTRAIYQPNLPLDGKRRVTASPAHTALSRRAAAWAVRDAPPLPRISTFFPVREMRARRSIYKKPSMSVL